MIRCKNCFKEMLKSQKICRYCGNNLKTLANKFTAHCVLLVFTLGIGNIIYMIVSKIKLKYKLKKYVFPEDRKYIKGNKYNILSDLEIIYNKLGKYLLKYNYYLEKMETEGKIVLNDDYVGNLYKDRYKETYFILIELLPKIKVFYEEYYKALNIEYNYFYFPPLKYYILFNKKENNLLEAIKTSILALKWSIRYDDTRDTKMVLQGLIKAYNKKYKMKYKFDYKTLTLYDDNTGVIVE